MLTKVIKFRYASTGKIRSFFAKNSLPIVPKTPFRDSHTFLEVFLTDSEGWFLSFSYVNLFPSAQLFSLYFLFLETENTNTHKVLDRSILRFSSFYNLLLFPIKVLANKHYFLCNTVLFCSQRFDKMRAASLLCFPCISIWWAGITYCNTQLWRYLKDCYFSSQNRRIRNTSILALKILKNPNSQIYDRAYIFLKIMLNYYFKRKKITSK